MTSTLETMPYEAFELTAGFVFPHTEISISAEEQRRLHDWCDIGEAVFGDSADPSLVSRLPIVVLANTVLGSRPRWIPVHTVQRIVQRRPIALGERLRLEGRIEAFEPHARGETMHCRWDYFDRDERCVLEVHPQALLINPAHSETPVVGNRAADTREWRSLGTKQCTPESTLGYCEGTSNPIHLDPETARSFGFRAPIIAGTQTMSYLLEPLYEAHAVNAFELSIGFHRPVFWDDLLRLETEADASSLAYLRAVNRDGRTVADCTIAAVQ